MLKRHKRINELLIALSLSLLFTSSSYAEDLGMYFTDPAMAGLIGPVKSVFVEREL